MSPDHIRWQVQGEGQARDCGAQRQGTISPGEGDWGLNLTG